MAVYLDALPVAFVALGVIGAVMFAFKQPLVLLAAYLMFIPWPELAGVDASRVISTALGVGFICAAIATQMNSWRPSLMPAIGWAWIGLAVASGAWAIDKELWANQTALLILNVGVAVVGAALLVEQRYWLRRVLWLYALSAVVAAAVGVTAAADPFTAGDFSRVTALDEQTPAVYVSRLLPALAFLLMEATGHSGALRVAAQAGVIVVIAAVALSATVSAWIGAAVITTFLVLRRRSVLAASLAIVAALSVSWLLMQIGYVETFLDYRLSRALSDNAFARLDIWNAATGILLGAPALGIGFGSFPAGVDNVALANAPFMPMNPAVLFVGRSSHSWFFGTLAELGVVGFVMLILFLVSLVRSVGDGRWETMARAMVIGVLAQGLFVNLLNQKSTWIPIMLILALAGASSLPSRAVVEGRVHVRRFGQRQGCRDDRQVGRETGRSEA